MRKNGRTGGTVTNVVIGLFLIYLVVSVAYIYFRSPGQGSTSSATNTTSSVTTVTSISSTSSFTSATTLSDNMSLAQLETLSFANASKCDGLLDRQSWDIALTTSGNATANLIQNTVYGFMQSTNQWTTLFRNNMSDPPAWVSLGLGNYTASLEERLAAQVIGTKNITLAAAVMKNYTSYVGGLGVAGLDWVTFGALTGEKVQLTTHNSTLAVAATFRGQIYQLYTFAFDCSYSKEQRAQFLGYALTMTALVVATSGKDGFGPKFEGLLTKLGLHDAWPKIKFHLKDISIISPGAAYETTMVLAALAKKFPTNFKELAPFTASRIAVMVQVLKDKGLFADEIEQKVAQLTKAVGESEAENHAADVADKISYEYEGSLRVTIDSDRTAVLFSQGGRHHISASFVANILPGFKVGELAALKVTVHKGFLKLPSYHVYEGGKNVEFKLPKEEVQPGDEVGLSFELLPVEDFAREIPPVVLTNPAYVPWVADSVVLKDFKVVDGVLEFRVLQKNQWSSVQGFSVKGEVVKYPGVSSYGGVYAQFSIRDYAGGTRDLKLRYDGFSSEGLQLVKGQGTSPSVSLVSYDGFRLSIVYGTDNGVSTIYLEPPSELIYSFGNTHPYTGSYLNLVQGKYTNAFQIDSVQMPRDLEKEMLDHGSAYDHGRLGAEIAYVVGEKNLGLKNIILEEPNKGGRDLYTSDNRVAIQARFLVDFTGRDRETFIQNQLFDLVDKLQDDYQHQPQMQDGYAILSYVDTDGTVKTIVLEVPKL